MDIDTELPAHEGHGQTESTIHTNMEQLTLTDQVSYRMETLITNKHLISHGMFR